MRARPISETLPLLTLLLLTMHLRIFNVRILVPLTNRTLFTSTTPLTPLIPHSGKLFRVEAHYSFTCPTHYRRVCRGDWEGGVWVCGFGRGRGGEGQEVEKLKGEMRSKA